MAKFEPQAELPVSEQAQIRRDKLAALQAEGRDPFRQTKYDFNADSAAIKADYEGFEGKTVKIANVYTYVYDFSLSDETALKTAIGLGDWPIVASYQNKGMTDVEYWTSRMPFLPHVRRYGFMPRLQMLL